MAEGIVQAAAQSAGAPNLEDLDDTGSQEPEGNGFLVKEFFWDKIILLLTTAIIGLTALDIVTELLRGGNGVVCFTADDNFSENQIDFVNSFCSSSVPDAQYLPIFVLVHGILIGAWHYIWKSSFSTHFDYFFSLTSHLSRFNDEISGDYPIKNLRIIKRLETEFCTYRKNNIIIWYRVKIILQFLTCVLSILLSFLVFSDFSVDFNCQLDSTIDPSPDPAQIPCIFASLRLFFLVRIFDTILVGLIMILLLFAFIWTLVAHSELGYEKQAKFSFGSGVSSDYFLPKPFAKGHVFSPRIKTDFDFLLMALYKTDSGLAHIFREGQVTHAKKKLVDSEIRYLSTYAFIDEEAEPEEVAKKMAPNWIIPDKFSFDTTQLSKPLQVPTDIAGAVMGFALRAPSNKYALDISFGSLGFSPAIARIFNQVGSFNFDPNFKDEEEAVIKYSFPTNLVTFRCHPDIFSLSHVQNNKFTEETHDEIWSKDYRTDFMVVGPVDKKEHLSTVTKLIDRFEYYFSEKAILLSVVPRQIEGRKTKMFPFKPPSKIFKPVSHSVIVKDGVLRWPPAEVNTGGTEKTSFSLTSGDTSCVFELKIYQYEAPESSDEESDSEEDEGQDEPKSQTSDVQAPLLKRDQVASKTDSPQLLKKSLNVEIEIESPTDETKV